MAGPTRVIGTPHSAVRDLLAEHGYSATREAVSSGTLLVPAEPSVSLIFNITEPSTGGPDAFVTGLARPFRSVSKAAAPGRHREWVAVRLNPLGAYTLLRGAVADIGEQLVDLSDVVGPAVREVAESMRGTLDNDRRFAFLDCFLLDRAARGSLPAPEVSWAWQRLHASRGRIPIARLAAETGWSHQHLVKRFREQIGRPPKTLARLIRCRAALSRIRQGGAWQQGAFDAGYYDQSHLARDIREFTGTTLTTYLAHALPCGCVAPPEAKFVQDSKLRRP